jgi:hypothetical protein
MIEKEVLLRLPEGRFQANVLIFEESDRKILWNIYKNWRALCDDLLRIRSRAVNLPEGLSEGAFCLQTGAVRLRDSIPGANSSWDCYDMRTNRRIQIKACSVLPDLTSFGPRSVWDELYFMDFFCNGTWDGSFRIYKIDSKDIYNHEVASSVTFRDQQNQGRRPRFSIYNDIIQKKGLRPLLIGRLS